MNVGFNEGGDRAYYSPAMDIVNMPEIERFKSEYAYMSTFLHEAAHASGASSRLNRDMTGTFGSQDYAREELRAEIASAFTAQATGIHYNQNDCMENHKAYVQSWISILENNPNELFSAIKDAEKISDYLIEKGEFDLERNVNLKNVEQNNILSAPHSQEEKKTAELLPKGWNWIINNEEGSGYLCSPENNKYFLFDLWAKQIEDLSGENNYFSGNISDLKIYEKIMKDYLSEHLHKIKNIPNNVTILFGANTKDYRYVKTPQAAIDEDIFIDSNTFNEWYERAETAERNWFSDHTTSTVEFAKKIANAVKNNNDSFEFEHEIFNVAEAMNKGKIHISKLKILDELTQEERELLQMNIEDLKDVDLNDFINSKTEERFERISQEPDISFEKWYIDNGYNPTMIPSDSAIPEAIIGITVPNTSHSFEKVKSRFSQIRYYKAAKDEYNLQVKAGNVPMKEVKKPLDLSKESDCAYCRMMIKKAFKNGDLETAKQWQDFYKNNIPIKKQKHMTL
jgi:hypothetical protein